jgi:hypothetical protein
MATKKIETRLLRHRATHLREVFAICGDHLYRIAAEEMETAADELDALRKEINTPELIDFVKAVNNEAAHQRQRWGTEHDAGKKPEDWFWLIGHLAGKSCRHFAMAEMLTEIANAPGFIYDRAGMLRKVEYHRDKGLHHIITTAAACANWHLYATGVDTRMRPGIDLAKTATDG